jgi:hypothetical protein
MFFELSTRTRQDLIGPVSYICKCGSNEAIVVSIAKERKLYWVVPVGTTHSVSVVCLQCKRARKVIGNKAKELTEQALINLQLWDMNSNSNAIKKAAVEKIAIETDTYNGNPCYKDR